MAWEVFQYRTVFDDFYESCSEDLQLSIDTRLSLLMELGNQAREPVSKLLEDGVFELRAKTARFLYYFEPGKKLIVVVAFLKNQRKVDRRYIEQAKKIRLVIQAGKEKASGIYPTH